MRVVLTRRFPDSQIAVSLLNDFALVYLMATTLTALVGPREQHSPPLPALPPPPRPPGGPATWSHFSCAKA